MDSQEIDPELIRDIRDDPVTFVEEILGREPYPYQKKFLRAGVRERVFVAGRQVGKTTVMSWYILWKFVTNEETDILIFLPSKRQAIEFFDSKLKAEVPDEWLENKEQYGITYETKSELHHLNGSRIISLPAVNDSGSGETIRGYTSDLVVVDEASSIDDDFFTSVLRPMLLTTQGEFFLSGTPWGKDGFFYERYNDDRWWHLHVETGDNPDILEEDIESMRIEMTETEFKREVLGQFTEKEKAAFSEETIKQCKYKGTAPGDTTPNLTPGPSFLGVDPARHGDDRAVFISLDSEGNVFDVQVEDDTSLTEVEGIVEDLHNSYRYSRIVIDETGLGGGPVDSLKQQIPVIEGLTFTLQSKQEIYQTLRKEMQNEVITIPDRRDVITELRSIERETTPRGRMKYQAESGGHDDIPDALALAVWASKGEESVDRAPQMFTFS